MSNRCVLYKNEKSHRSECNAKLCSVFLLLCIFTSLISNDAAIFRDIDKTLGWTLTRRWWARILPSYTAQMVTFITAKEIYRSPSLTPQRNRNKFALVKLHVAWFPQSLWPRKMCARVRSQSPCERATTKTWWLAMKSNIYIYIYIRLVNGSILIVNRKCVGHAAVI